MPDARSPQVEAMLEQARQRVAEARRRGNAAELAGALMLQADAIASTGRFADTVAPLQEAIAASETAHDNRLAGDIARRLAASFSRIGDAVNARYWEQRAFQYRDAQNRDFQNRERAQSSTASSTAVAMPAPRPAPPQGHAAPPARFNTAAPSAAPLGPATADAATQSPGRPAKPLWPWIALALCVVLLLAWWRSRQHAAELATKADRLHRSQLQARSLNARLQAESDQLRQQAVQDMLTGALTRHAFAAALKELLEHASHYGRPVALLVLDLDHFKSINDEFGHLTGDAALKLMTGIARENLDSAALLGRFGGDEFLIAVCDHDRDMAQALGESIRQAVVRRVVTSTTLRRLRVSIGVAHAIPASGYDLEDLFRRADAALYAAKRAGRDRVALENEEDSATAQPAVRHLSASHARDENDLGSAIT